MTPEGLVKSGRKVSSMMIDDLEEINLRTDKVVDKQNKIKAGTKRMMKTINKINSQSRWMKELRGKKGAKACHLKRYGK